MKQLPGKQASGKQSLWDKFREFDDRMSQPALHVKWAHAQGLPQEFLNDYNRFVADYNDAVDELNDMQARLRRLEQKVALLEGKDVKVIEHKE